MKRLGFIGIFFLLTVSFYAQEEKMAFDKYGILEGMPEEAATDILQDDQGFIWVGTQNGLVKFDGYKIQVYKGSSLDSVNFDKLLFRNLGGGLLKAKDGKLWIGGVLDNSGVASFDPKNEKFKSYLPSHKDTTGMMFGSNELLFEDANDNIWFVNADYLRDKSRISRINTITHEIKSYPHSGGFRKLNDIVLNFFSLFSAIDGTVWTLDNGNLFCFDRENDRFEKVISAGDEISGTKEKDSITSILKGNRDYFILNTKTGFHIWDPIKRKVKKSYSNKNKKQTLLSLNDFDFAFEDIKGQYWAFHINGEFSLIDPVSNTSKVFTYGKEDLKFDRDKNIGGRFFPVFQDVNGLWFFRYGNFDLHYLYYDFSSKSFSYYDLEFNDEENLISRHGLMRFIKDNAGLLWIATRPNFYKQSPKTRRISDFVNLKEDTTSIISNEIRKLFQDKTSQLWIGTDKGILQENNGKFNEVGWFSDTNNGKSLGSVNSIIQDSNGTIWVGSSEGLFRWSVSRQLFKKLHENYGKINVRLIEGNKGTIWVSIVNSGVYILNKNTGAIIESFEAKDKDAHGLLSNRIYQMFLDSNNTIWLGDSDENNFGLFKFNNKDKSFKHYKRDDNDSLTLNSFEIGEIKEDDLGRVWVGTDDGINLYDREKDVFYKTKKNFNISSTADLIGATNGKVWVASYASGGLALVGPNIDDIEMFGEETGLLHNDISSMVLDDEGKLWLATERGLSVMDTLTRKFSNYFEKDGFQKYPRNSVSIKTKNGEIWIGGDKGLNHVVPSKLKKKDSTLASVYITSLAILDSVYSSPDGEIFTEAVSFTKEIDLSYWQKDLSFEFVALHYLRSEDNQYSWKLENYDKHWTVPSNERKVSYTNLSPGTYTFKVKGSNSDGVWNDDPATLKINISNPWWLTLWAYLVYILLLVYLGYRVHLLQRAKTLRLAREKNQQKELEQAKEIKKAYAELKATQNQLIQSEKMASLGELTAGIAHEIQNPLNFVNNFSELNTELIEELDEEINNKNFDEVKALAKDIKENEEKINHHGKRADSIVKGMLQHSRVSSGKKELTDINVLVDEYLRLSYHGLRAKDKSFNAIMNTNFDNSIGKINIMGQDVGRVVLNIITNAFHATQEKKVELGKDYNPTLTVATKKDEKSILITIEDNGNGIPDKIKDKIFHPFFTTKASGKGTGLGLSLSYDIIKSHGGELKVVSKVGEGTTFSILIPIA